MASWMRRLRSSRSGLVATLLVLIALGAALPSCGRPAGTDRDYARGVMAETYRWIRDHAADGTGLPYDDHRRGEFTSSTNIGLYAASVAVAAHVGLEDRAEAVLRVSRLIESASRLEGYKGWPQCWASTKDLSPAPHDRVVSTLDLGNYWAGWIVARRALPELSDSITAHLETMDWGDLYDEERGLLYGGYDRGKGAFTPGWVLDVMGTDARLAFFLSIAAGDVPPEMWGRVKTDRIEHDGLSYYRPGWMGGGLFMQALPGIFLDERATPVGRAAADFAYAQMRLARAIEAPAWGWSASDSPRDGYLGWGGLRRAVVTPHASALASMYYPRRAVENLRALERLGARAPIEAGGETRAYGFRDALDWTTGEATANYLVLDQAMLFLSLANAFEDGIVWRLFGEDPLVRAGLEKIPDLRPTETANLAVYAERDAGAVPAPAGAAAGGETTILVADFEGEETGRNLLGGASEAWSNDPSRVFRAARVRDGDGGALAIDYDVSTPPAWGGWRTALGGVDARAADALVLEIRGDAARGGPGTLKIELEGPAGPATYRLLGITAEPRRRAIPLADFEGMNVAWSKVGSLVLVVEDGRAASKRGRLLLGRVALEALDEAALARARLENRYTTGLIESFDDASAFRSENWEGTSVRLRAAPGRTAGALEIRYDLARTKQWVQAKREVAWRLPPRYILSFDLRRSGAANTLEIKLTDGDGSVFGVRLPLKDLPDGAWERVEVPSDRITRLWGGDDRLGDVAGLWISVSQGDGDPGGAGAVAVDGLRIDPAAD